MKEFLINHALRNVWGNPAQDISRIFAGARITPKVGSLNSFQMMKRKVDLPNKGKRYHVFQIGQIHPQLLGFNTNRPDWATEQWINIADAVETNKVMVSIYNNFGISVPLFQSYLLYSKERNLVLAVEENNKLKVNFNEDQICFRVYNNAWFSTSEADAVNDFMRCKGTVPLNNQEVVNFQIEVTSMKQLPGYVFCFCNGMLVNDLTLITVAPGDTIEYLYDSSIKRVVTFTARDLISFNSDLDNKAKYLLHYAGAGDKTIDYQNDIDIHILAPGTGSDFKGYYYHHNTTESIRMVTHRDYSIVTDYFENIASKLASDLSDVPLDIMNFKVQMVIRKSGTNSPLIYDNNRIFEMYKLSDDKIVQAMVGLNSSLPNWEAINLENSPYTQLMRVSSDRSVTMDLIQGAYGYNSISKLVGDTPTKTTLISGRQTAVLPPGLVGNCTVYEYDQDGILLGYYYYTGDETYHAADDNCRMIEAVYGQGSSRPDVTFGQDNITLPTDCGYRVYMCFLNGGIPNNVWMDITGSSKYEIVDGKLVWTGEQYDQFLMIRKDNSFVTYNVQTPCVNGNLFFALYEEEDRFGNGYENHLLPVPSGEIDIFLNGRSLIKDLDYIVDFPKIYITNKKYLIQPGETAVQTITVRLTGFCTSDLKFQHPDDYGFIEYGFLSNNNRYDIRDDKVLRITVDGKTMHRSDLQFSEEHDGVSVADPTNGLPYQVKDIVVPLKDLVNETTYSLRDKSIAIDNAVSDYMTIKLPEPSRGDLNIISDKYPLVSAFTCRILDAIRSSEITDDEIAAARTDNQILALCKPFEYALAYDPVNPDLNFDYRYVDVHPHHNDTTINLPLNQYRFLAKAVGLYCHGVVKLSPFFTVT